MQYINFYTQLSLYVYKKTSIVRRKHACRDILDRCRDIFEDSGHHFERHRTDLESRTLQYLLLQI